MNQSELAEYRRKIDAKIRADIAGPHRVHIFGTATANSIPLMHTIGLLEAQRPEIVVLGMPPEAAFPVLNSLAAWCRQEPALAPEQTFQIEDYPGIVWRTGVVSVQFCQDYMLKMHRLYRKLWQPGSPAKVLQILWPDEHGRHPGPLFTQDHQPVLAGWRPDLATYHLN